MTMTSRRILSSQSPTDGAEAQGTPDRDERGDDWADIIDMLTMYPEARRQVVQVLGELEATRAR